MRSLTLVFSRTEGGFLRTDFGGPMRGGGAWGRGIPPMPGEQEKEKEKEKEKEHNHKQEQFGLPSSKP